MPEAMAMVRDLGKASTSLLQRRFRIGYTRAARLIDQMEEMGIIGPPTGTSKAREVYRKTGRPPRGLPETAATTTWMTRTTPATMRMMGIGNPPTRRSSVRTGHRPVAPWPAPGHNLPHGTPDRRRTRPLRAGHVCPHCRAL